MRAWSWRLAAAIGLSLLVLTTTARLTLLDAHFDTKAIGAVNGYERLYTQVLTSPSVQSAISQGLAALPIDPSYLTSNMRLVVPPPVLEELVREAIGRYVDVILGKPGSLSLDRALQPVVDNVVRLVQELAPGAIAASPQLRAGSVTAFDKDVRALLAQLAAGDVDLNLPTVKLAPGNVARVAQILTTGLPAPRAAELRTQIDPLLASGDLTSAFALVLPAYLGSDTARRIAVAASTGAQTALQSLPAGLAAIAPHPVLPLGLGWLTAIAIALTVAVFRPMLEPRGRRARGFAIALGGAVLALLVAGLVMRSVVVDPLQEAGHSTALGPASRQLILDVDAQLRRGVTHTYLELMATLAGLAVIAGAVARAGSTRAERPRRIVSGIGAGTAALGAGILVVAALPPTHTPLACNGSAHLCDRRYDQVTYLTSHNAMSNSDHGFLAANQDPSITAQLDNGVRGLMLDLHYWTTPEQAAPYLAGLSPRARAAWSPLVTSFQPQPGVWLCHELCQIGADPAPAELDQLKRWLTRNPDEVVTLILEDDVSPADVQTTIRAAGLDRWIVTPPPSGTAWPTLREMIDRHHTLAVFTQYAKLSGPIRNLYQLSAETPYAAATLPGFSCEPGRGPATAQLFLINNWITNGIPSRATALSVNKAAFLLERVHRCEAERGMRATFVAVDFAQVGDPLNAVDALNARPSRS